ncbi:MAG: helix-turn-helix domain-containing protein [Planctomycetes bacterium]|nr:helix-turn-helix domain-containing protein [Planctomycetota bacterium]
MIPDNVLLNSRVEDFIHLFEHLPSVYFVVKDRQGKVISANSFAAKTCGLKCKDDMLGLSDYDLFDYDRAHGYFQDDLKVMETGEPMIAKVELAPDPNHAINWFVVNKFPLKSSSGEIIGCICLARGSRDEFHHIQHHQSMNIVLDHIRQFSWKTIKNDELAKLCHQSTSQFQKNFKRLFKISPQQHIINVRIKSACRLLKETSKSMTTIASEVGFYDHSHFSRLFLKAKGMLPSEYRNSSS